jgi:hypothetical protein
MFNINKKDPAFQELSNFANNKNKSLKEILSVESVRHRPSGR